MAVHYNLSQAEQINRLFGAMRDKLEGVPGSLRGELEEGLEELRSSVLGIMQSTKEPDSATHKEYVRALLSASEARYIELGESLSSPLAVFGPDLRLIYRNPAAEHASSIPNEQVLGKTFEEVYPKLAGSAVHEAFLSAVQSRQVQTVTNQWSCPDGGVCHYEITFYPGRDWIVVVSENVSERENALEALRESEERFRTVWEVATDALALSDAEGTVTAANPAYCRLYGYAMEELVGHNFAIIFPEAERASAEQQYREVFCCQPVPERFVSLIQQKSGEQRVVEANIAFIEKDGQRQAMLSVIHDITERANAEEELRHATDFLRESEGRFRAMADGTPVMIWVHNANGKMEFINQAWTDYFGPTLEEVKANGWTPLVHPDDTAGYVDVFAECLREQKPFHAQTRTMHRSGQWRWIESFGQPRFSEAGEFLGMAGSSIDITERKQAEAALRKSEEMFARAFHSSPVAQAITRHRDGRYIDVNEQLCRLLGYSREEIIGKTTLELGLYEKESERAEIMALLQEKGSLHNVERSTHNRAGKKLTALLSFEPVEVNGEDCLLTTMIDITERKSIEAEREALMDELRLQKDLLERLVEFSPIAISMLKGPEHRFVLVNTAQRRLFPTISEYIGRTAAEVWPDINEHFLPMLDQVLHTGVPYFVTDVPYWTDKGSGQETAYYSYSYTPLLDANGTIEGILVLTKDTTDEVRIRQRLEAELEERKVAEEALENAHSALVLERNLLRAVMDALPVGLAIYDKNGGVTQANAAYEAVWGTPRPPANSVDDYDAYKAWWVENGQRVQAHEWASAKSLSTGQPVIGQYLRILRFDGTDGYIVNSGAPVRDSNGELIGGVVTIMDITTQKRLEIDQQEAQMQMEVQRRLMDQREKERQGIARDIHDGPIQTLASTAFNIQFVKESFSDPTLTVELNQIALNIKGAIRELREVVNDLRPPSILRFGLTRAIMMHAEDLRERYPETNLDLTLDEGGSALSEQACLAVFRVFQEGMNNIFKHAGAKNVWVRYEIAAAEFLLELRDDGKGFSVPADFNSLTGGGHFGLAGMKERMEAVGGKLTIQSSPGSGTTVTIRGPLSGANKK